MTDPRGRNDEPFLTDGVVVVNPLTVADAEAQWSGEDEEQARRFGWYPKRSSIDSVREFLADTERQWREDGSRRTFGIRLATTRTLVGGCEARLQGESTAHLSWWIFPEHRGRGFGSRGVRLMCGYIIDAWDVRRLVAFIEADNLASRSVASNVGLVELGLDTSCERPMLRYELTI